MAEFCLILNTRGGPACCQIWIRVMHCHGAGNLPFITIVMNKAIYPGPRALRVGMVM